MTEVRFYHLTKTPVEKALPDLLLKALDVGKKSIIRVKDKQAVAPLSKHLWVCRRDGFIPHGIEGDGNEPLQPIWLTADNDNPNNADTLFLLEGAAKENLKDFTLVCLIFNGANDEDVTQARADWAQLKKDGFALTYWQQSESGGWQKK